MAAAEVAKLKSVRGVAKSYGICHVTLHWYIREKKKLEAAGIRETSSIIVGYSRHRRVFNAGQEEELRQYLKAASAMYYGLSPREKEGCGRVQLYRVVRMWLTEGRL
ncbi:hypothetical protein SKAU_G00377540 [Synaphobranchus kaupii]|uniref:HTH psq-type domain-containing protein n=1 Tax=Synaphobranchus kaupii TaxID=118154 RepID=A0A9Q1ED03_SYNKA|nr:hypothetical protein SKAU_G00377540 [Synaphobranchus kaupii]